MNIKIEAKINNKKEMKMNNKREATINNNRDANNATIIKNLNYFTLNSENTIAWENWNLYIIDNKLKKLNNKRLR